MIIPDPDEFERGLSTLLDNVDEKSMLYNISHSYPGNSGRKYILLPASLYYQYERGEWWSINTEKIYEPSIPWYRQAKNWPIYPILNDNLVFEFRKIFGQVKFLFRNTVSMTNNLSPMRLKCKQ